MSCENCNYDCDQGRKCSGRVLGGPWYGLVAPQPVNITLKSRILALPKSLALGCGTQSCIFLILETGGFSICILQGAKIALEVVG